MTLDKWGLPVQQDGDAMDQLNRVGLIMTANTLSQKISRASSLISNCYSALYIWLQPRPGVFIRCNHADENNVSADQLIPVISAWIAMGESVQAYQMFEKMILRFGFAQNTHDGLSRAERVKIPDFMFFRAMPLFARNTSTPFFMRYLFDLYLPVLVIGDLLYKTFGKDPADVNVTLATLLTCVRVHPTFISKLCWRVWTHYGDVYARLTRYHRAESGGNPDIAKFFEVFL